MEVKEGGLVIIKGDNIENGGLKIVKDYRGAGGEGCEGNKKEKPLTEEELKKKVDFVKPRIKVKKLYFSVCRYMMWRKMVPERDFQGACEILERLYPGLNLDPDDLDSYYVLSFRKTLDEWNPEDAPVHGKTYNKYYTVAELMDAV